MIKKILLPCLVLFFAMQANAQIEISKLIGKNSNDYSLGYGGLLKFSFPISDADDIALEAGVHFFFEKGGTDYGIADVPLKAGYKYTINRSGYGLYLEPQLGYNIYGVNSYYDPNYGNICCYHYKPQY